MNDRTIPKQLQNSKFRFCLVEPNGKKAIEKGWQEYNNYSFDNAKLIKHLESGGNVGILGGYGDLVIIDFDDKQFQEDKGHKFVSSFACKSAGKGLQHKYYLTDTSENFRIPGKCDVQGKGTYVVCPPSKINQKEYSVFLDKKINYLSINKIKSILGQKEKERVNYQEVIKGHEQGGRNNALFKLACSLKSRGVGITEVMAVVETANKKNNPPLSQEEINKIITSAFSYKNRVHLTPPNSTTLHPTPPNSTPERDYLIKSMLSKGRPKIYQIKYGIHNGVYYFGTVLYQGTIPKTAVITSDRKVFVNWGYKEGQRNEIKEDFGLYYRYDFEHDVLDNHFSTDGIQRFLDGKDEFSLKDCFLELEKINKDLMYYPTESSHKVIALDIIVSYFQAIFEANGRTFLESEKGSGKTRQCTIFKKTSCNSIMSADISKSSFFRLMESTCGTLIIDDFDDISEEQKNDILQHYKTGYKNSAKSVRTGDNKQRRADAFRNYGHTIMNNTSGLDPISADRTKFIPIIKHDGLKTKKNIEENNPKWQKLTDKLFIMTLQNWEKVQKSYESCTSTIFSGRKFELIRPILAIAELISNDLKRDVEDFFQETFNQADLIDVENDWDYLTFEIFKNQSQGHTIKLTDISETIFEKTGDLNAKDRKRRVHGISVYLGKLFKRLPGIFKVKPIKGYNHVEFLDSRKLEKYLQAKWGRVELGGGGGVGNGSQEEVVIDLKELIKKEDKGPGVSFDTIKDLTKWDEAVIEKELSRFSKEGEIFEHKPDRWKVLQ